jgi:hypothetical protein
VVLSSVVDIPAKINDLSIWLFTIPSKVINVVDVGYSAVVWDIWKTRNDVCFDHVYPSDPYHSGV